MKLEKVQHYTSDNYTTRCLVGYKYFKDHCQLIAVDLGKQKELDADPKAIQQIKLYGW